MYEVPVNATQSGGGSIEHKYYELTESTHAIPTMYEYATLEPNETMVINFFNITRKLSINTSQQCFQTLRKYDSLAATTVSHFCVTLWFTI